MPRKAENERIAGEHFTWLLSLRKGFYTADGRGNRPSVGRHSLGTRDRATALTALRKLDRLLAAERGLVTAPAPDPPPTVPRSEALGLEDGAQQFLDEVGFACAAGGARPATQKRYRPVLRRFVAFAAAKGLRAWQEVRGSHVKAYCQALHLKDYKPRTITLEGNVLKQVLKWMAGEGKIERVDLSRCRFPKINKSDTYCYTDAEVKAMIAHCRREARLRWLEHVIVALACTGLRIGELRDLRWSDLDFAKEILTLKDTTLLERRSAQQEARRTKSGRDRWVPLHPDLTAILKRLARSKDGYVFHGAKGGRLKPDIVRRALVRDVLKPLAASPVSGVGPDFARGRVHSLRHYFCSRAAARGLSELVIRRWLGHANSLMVDRYYHQDLASARAQIRELPSLEVEGGGAGNDDECDKQSA